MNSILRAAVVYFGLLLLFRISGRRSLGQLTTFDFILLLIIGEATQNALLGNDYSLINGFLVIITLMSIDIGLSLWKRRSPDIQKLLDGVPLVIVEQGNPLRERMDKARIDEDDILTAARRLHGLERMEQIKYAVLGAQWWDFNYSEVNGLADYP